MQTYVPWNVHEPSPGVYNWEGTANLTGFLDVAANLGLNVLLRAGPYICGEWDFGGLPWWLAYQAVSSCKPQIVSAASEVFALSCAMPVCGCKSWPECAVGGEYLYLLRVGL